MGSHSAAERGQLTEIARASIEHGLDRVACPRLDMTGLPEALTQAGASFVTLHKSGDLRGCIGSISAERPLAQDVSENAYKAAFRDPRFPPLRRSEFSDLELHLAVLSSPEPLPVQDEADLLGRLRPGVDGLILSDGTHHSTFLPSVWDKLPTAKEFVEQLKRKAGLPADYWSRSICLERYTTESW